VVDSSRLVLVTGLPGSGKSTVAEQVATLIGASVLGHDWAMSGLRPYDELWKAMDSMVPPGRGAVGWSICRALARAQVRRGASAVLDGVARPDEVERCRQVAEEEGCKFVVVLAECADRELHHERIRHRVRSIPGWYELTWDDVERTRTIWLPPDHVDLTLQATESVEHNGALIARLLGDT